MIASLPPVMVGGLLAVVLANVALLGVAAIAKLRAPVPFATSLRAAGLPAGAWAGRAVAVVEVAVAIGAVFGGRIGLVVLAVADVVMAGFLVWLQRRAAGASCGCFGAASSPASAVHIGVNVACAVAAGTFAVHVGSGNVANSVKDATGSVPAGVAWCALLVLASYLAYVVMTMPFGMRAARGAN